ncbi:hsp71-like protein [Gigaspora margarita]|uniref:Hsp71-like protein n=1 Tax=Gigaspora margarita TaxID=4874 RepID=A0A8H3XL26_GIGMA|nr:hsp71-like protein [Gigaspora margarita]
MIADAEKYRAEDEKVALRIQARNALESYVYNLRNTLQDENKINVDDKRKLEDVIKKAITWLENNQEAEMEEYEYKQKSIEETANPIMVD